MKCLVLGAGGIIGQHMLVSEPEGVDGVYMRRGSDSKHFTSWDLLEAGMMNSELTDPEPNGYGPDVVVYLAGENRVDVVEATPEAYETINYHMPRDLARACERKGVRFIYGSSQAVFSGEDAPYKARDAHSPINQYGLQKSKAEEAVLMASGTVARFTFVLGVRPFQEIGRRNPLEDMLEKPKQLQVDDRWFSVCFAHDAAQVLWQEILNPKDEPVFNVGHPFGRSRYDVARDLVVGLHGAIQTEITPIGHEYFSGLAPRAHNTKWAEGSRFFEDYESSLVTSFIQWKKYTNA